MRMRETRMVNDKHFEPVAVGNECFDWRNDSIFSRRKSDLAIDRFAKTERTCGGWRSYSDAYAAGSGVNDARDVHYRPYTDYFTGGRFT